MKTVVNISIDDVCPHPIMRFYAVSRITDLLDKYPNLKCSLFVPTRLKRYKYKEKEYPLENYPDFVDQLKSLPSKNFEICYHGHMHGNSKPKSNNDEFRYIDKQKTIELLNESKKVFDSLGLTVNPVFRPPGFWMNAEAFAGCKEFGIKVLALHNKKQYIACYAGEHLKYERVIYIGRQPDNNRHVELLFHAGKDQKDFLNKQMFKELCKKLDKWSPSFSFLGDL